MTPRRIFLIIAAAILAIPVGYALFILWFFATGGIFRDCGEEIVARAVSPDGRLQAVAFLRDCGATTRVSTHVKIEGPGNLGDVSVFIYDGSVPVEVRWEETGELAIHAKDVDSAAVRETIAIHRGIRIRFVAETPP